MKESIHKLKLIDDKPIAKNSIKGVWLSISQMDINATMRMMLVQGGFRVGPDSLEEFVGGTDMWRNDDVTIDFSIKVFCVLINKHDNVGENSFKWLNWIPLKISYFVWRLFKSKIPLF
uniref:Uncharacterized protein n=1 Tax=Lactuca sativa TaxID=4236 RepID=A0A9R1W5W0_LACSA|nr:hypothetical protein LSAT_V11C200064180 [Lactuca sativa]